MNVISFKGEYQFLSNFWFCPIVFNYLGREWKARSVEHAFQACKSTDPATVEWVLNQYTAADAKRAGRKVTIRPDWDRLKDQIMMVMLAKKFDIPALRDKLEAITGSITEGNYWCDNYWGACRCFKCCGKPGKNMLGKMLMKLRGDTTNVQAR